MRAARWNGPHDLPTLHYGTSEVYDIFGMEICKQIDVNTFLQGYLWFFLILKHFLGGSPPRPTPHPPFAMTVMRARRVY
jgi:hypothetical protein